MIRDVKTAADQKRNQAEIADQAENSRWKAKDAGADNGVDGDGNQIQSANGSDQASLNGLRQ